MDLTFTSEQEILQDSAVKFVQKAYDFDQYQKSLKAPGQCDAAIWAQLAEFGWLALPVPESADGLAGSTLDMALVAEALGAGLVVEPYLLGAVLPALAFSEAGSAAQTSLLAAVVAGDAQLSLAYAESTARFDPAHCETVADKSVEGFELTGHKHCAFNAPNASHLLVSAMLAGEVALFLVPREASGVKLDSHEVLGGGTAADVSLHKVRVPADAKVGDLQSLELALDRATAIACAQALGGMTALFERTGAYLKTRKQFGVPIGSFQVLQHRAVDMFIELEQCRSMVLMAAAKADSASGDDRKRSLSAAKAYVAKASKFVAQQAVQLHGGIGVTEELDVGHYFRQLTAFGTCLGDRAYHLARFEASATE